MSYSLRPARAEDVDEMMAIAPEGLRPYVEAIWGWDSRDHDERFRTQFEPACISIIQCNGRDVGYVKVEDRKDYLFLAGIYVGKDGRRHGIGREVLVDLMRKATPMESGRKERS